MSKDEEADSAIDSAGYWELPRSKAKPITEDNQDGLAGFWEVPAKAKRDIDTKA